MKPIFILILTLVFIQSCATKNYGRQGILTTYEKNTLTCREIRLEEARVQGFLAYVNDKSQFSEADVLAIFADFGIGNIMEKEAAVASAQTRSQQLLTLKYKRRCAGRAKKTAHLKTYALFINTVPNASRIRVMNIIPKYKRGMKLISGSYQISVTHSGYQEKKLWVRIKNRSINIDVILKKNY